MVRDSARVISIRVRARVWVRSQLLLLAQSWKGTGLSSEGQKVQQPASAFIRDSHFENQNFEEGKVELVQVHICDHPRVSLSSTKKEGSSERVGSVRRCSRSLRRSSKRRKVSIN